MAKVHGKGGSLTCTNLTAGIGNWELDLKGTADDCTDFSDVGVKAFLSGQTEWSGSASGFWDAANTVAIGATITGAIFTVTSGRYYTGNAIVTGIKVGTPKDGVVTYSIDFQGTGALVPTLS